MYFIKSNSGHLVGVTYELGLLVEYETGCLSHVGAGVNAAFRVFATQSLAYMYVSKMKLGLTAEQLRSASRSPSRQPRLPRC